MKTIREYHIEYYWMEQAEKRRKKAEFKEKAVGIATAAALFLLEGAVCFEFLRQVFMTF